MNDRTQDSPMPDPLDELLVAYLDGELTPSESDDVERRLAVDAEVRTRLQQLERANEMLGILPRSAPTEQFTQATVAMAAQTAEAGTELAVRRQKAGLVMWCAAGAVGTLASLIVGFVVVRQRLTAPNEKLRRDLPVIQRIDEYRTAESVEFLRRLEHEGLFVMESDDAL